MGPEKPRLTLLEQREIEARIVGPLIHAFAGELGTDRTLAIVRDVIGKLALEGGRELALAIGEHTLEAFARSLDRWRETARSRLRSSSNRRRDLHSTSHAAATPRCIAHSGSPTSGRACRASAILLWRRASTPRLSSRAPRPSCKAHLFATSGFTWDRKPKNPQPAPTTTRVAAMRRVRTTAQITENHRL